MLNSNAGANCHLTIHAPDNHTRISVLDADLRKIPLNTNLGSAEVALPRGIYTVKFQRGEGVSRKFVVLTDENSTATIKLDEEDAPAFESTIPLAGTTTHHEFHHYPAEQISRTNPILMGTQRVESSLMIFIRDPLKKATNDLGQGVKLATINGSIIADFSKIGSRDIAYGWFGAHIALQPGPFILYLPNSKGGTSGHIVYLYPQWQTQIFIYARCPAEEKTAIVIPSSISILIARLGQGFDASRNDSKWTEMALKALRFKTNIPTRMQQEMLCQKYDSPLLCLYAGLLQLRRKECDLLRLQKVFENLLSSMGPVPDVLSFGLGIALHNQNFEWFPKDFTDSKYYGAPPMLAESWGHIIAASIKYPLLVSGSSFTARIAKYMSEVGPWLCWPSTVSFVGSITSTKVINHAGSLLSSMLSKPEIGRVLNYDTISLLKNKVSDISRDSQSLSDVIAKIVDILEEKRSDLKTLTKNLDPLEIRILRHIEPTLDPLLALYQEFSGAKGTATISPETMVKRLSLPVSIIIASLLKILDALLVDSK